MSKLVGSFLGLAAGLAVAPAAAQQEPGDPEAGYELAAQLCTSCHIVGGEASGSDLAPPFPVIAKNPEISLIELHAWVGPAHPMLPHLALTQDEVADIDAYLESLREGAAPPQPREPEPSEPQPSEPDLPQAPPDRIGPPIGEEPSVQEEPSPQ